MNRFKNFRISDVPSLIGLAFSKHENIKLTLTVSSREILVRHPIEREREDIQLHVEKEIKFMQVSLTFLLLKK